MRRFIKLPARGDTIVEVMISMAVLAVVVGAAYASATKSFNASLNSQYRDQGVSYAQQQLELIKESDNATVVTIGNYEVSPGTPFCINPVDKSRLTVSSGNCKSNNYTTSITYCNTGPCATGQAVNSFMVTTTWDSATSLPQQSALFYKPNDSFAGTTVACTTGGPGCASTITDPPSVQVSASLANPINPGVTDNITWSAVNIKPGSCAATGPGTFSTSVNSNADPGSYPFSSSAPGSYTFRISCTDNAGNPIFNSAIVIVNNPIPSANTGSANPRPTYNTATVNGTVNPNGFATTYVFNYGTTAAYGSTTPAASAGAGTSNVSVSAALSGLSASTLYHFRICATNPYGTTCGNDNTFTTANNPPPVVNYFYASPSSIGYGGSTTLYWGSTNATSCTYGPPTGSTGTGALYSTTTYGLNCSGPGGSVGTYYATVSVSPPPPPPPDCNDHTHDANGFPSGWSFSIGGNNPCGIGIAQCNVFNSGGGSLGSFGYGNANPATGSFNPAGASFVGCADIMGHWFYGPRA